MNRKATTILIFLTIAHWHCIQAYVSPYKAPATGYLVVDGYIVGNGPTSIKLSRVIPLSGDTTVPMVAGAQLQLEGTDGSVNLFADSGNGVYWMQPVALNSSTKYRLRITNAGGETYLSDFVAYKPTPPIDTLNWMEADTGVGIDATTHDPTGNTRYYQWKFTETWEYTSAEPSGWIFQGDTLAVRQPSEQINNCYRTDSSTVIIVGTSEKLAQDVIYEQPLITIPSNDQRLSIEYSTLVSQYALTDSGFDYLTQLKANTEQLGSIFDPMPSQPAGNIHCLSNPGEPVIGYISAGTIQQQRIFINRSQVPQWLYFPECPVPNKVFPTDLDSMIFYFDYLHYVPIDIPSDNVVSANEATCVDCRVQGGTTQKPSFWP